VLCTGSLAVVYVLLSHTGYQHTVKAEATKMKEGDSGDEDNVDLNEGIL